MRVRHCGSRSEGGILKRCLSMIIMGTERVRVVVVVDLSGPARTRRKRLVTLETVAVT